MRNKRDAMTDTQRKTTRILRCLMREYPQARIALRYTTPFELLAATILSAQCTDVRVNMITEKLFARFPTVAAFAAAAVPEMETAIRSAGCFRRKARHIIDAAGLIEREYHGQVPDTMEALLRLPGVARKTANIVLFNVFGKQEGIAVDTHVRRLSRRLGLTTQQDPARIEKDLMRQIPRRWWGMLNHVLIAHGRAVCRARNPRCADCVLREHCEYYGAKTAGI